MSFVRRRAIYLRLFLCRIDKSNTLNNKCHSMLGLLLDLALLLSPIVFSFLTFPSPLAFPKARTRLPVVKICTVRGSLQIVHYSNRDPCTCTGCTGEWTTNTAAAGCAAATC